jgi:hypothetical protein
MSFQQLNSYHSNLINQIDAHVNELAEANSKNENFVRRIHSLAEKFLAEIRSSEEFNAKASRNGGKDFKFCFLIKANSSNELGRRLVVTDKQLTQGQIESYDEFIDFREDNRINLVQERYWELRTKLFQQEYKDVRIKTLCKNREKKIIIFF